MTCGIHFLVTVFRNEMIDLFKLFVVYRNNGITNFS
jgi:hypothetical protein